MNIFKWLGFLIFYPIMTLITYYILINLTTAFGLWLITKLNLFWLIFIGGIIQGVIYLILFGGASLYTNFIAKSSPKGNIAKFYKLIINLIIAFISFRGIYIYSLTDIFSASAKGLLLGFSLVPVYLGVLYYTFIAPFIEEDFL